MPAYFWMQPQKMPPKSQVTTPEVVSGVSESVAGSPIVSGEPALGLEHRVWAEIPGPEELSESEMSEKTVRTGGVERSWATHDLGLRVQGF